jgi:hypothetical protein
MTYARLSQRTNQWMKDVRSWVTEEELEQIKRVKGDISISLWVRRQIKKGLLEGSRVTNSDPHQQQAVVPNAYTNPKDSNPEEVEA